MLNENVILNDMNKSSIIVKEKINPIIETLRPGWRVFSIEGEENTLSKILDMNCGLDYLLHSKNFELVYGIASRIQYGVNYRTFTVRKTRESHTKTEYEKRKISIACDSIYPKYTMQAYIVDNEVQSLAIIQTKDLIEAIELCRYSDIKKTHSDKVGQAEFYICKWDDLKKYYKVNEYNKKENQRINTCAV